MDSFAALSDPTRREIVRLLAEGDRKAGNIVSHFTMSAPAISQHLNILRETGLIQVQRRGRERIYSLDPKGLGEMEEWVMRTKAIWNNRLNALEQVLKEER